MHDLSVKNLSVSWLSIRHSLIQGSVCIGARKSPNYDM